MEMIYLQEGTMLHGPIYDYRIERVLGQGSFGITYLAALKIKGDLGTLNSHIQVSVMELLSEDYDSITNLGSQSIPGPGLPHFFLGIEVRIAEFISFFEPKKNEFVFKGKYTRAELERRKDFS